MRTAFAKTLLLFVALQILAVDVAISMAPPCSPADLSFKVKKHAPISVVLAARAETGAEEESKEKGSPAPVFDFDIQAECLRSTIIISTYPPTTSSLQHCQPATVLLCSLLI